MLFPHGCWFRLICVLVNNGVGLLKSCWWCKDSGFFVIGNKKEDEMCVLKVKTIRDALFLFLACLYSSLCPRCPESLIPSVRFWQRNTSFPISKRRVADGFQRWLFCLLLQENKPNGGTVAQCGKEQVWGLKGLKNGVIFVLLCKDVVSCLCHKRFF